MGKNLHYSILPFFKARMAKHSKVAQVTDISDEEDYVFSLKRTDTMPEVKVHLSDAYLYTLMDFYSRPDCIKEGDFVLIARPEAKVADRVVATAREAKIGMCGIGKLMGALNRAQVWEYEPPNEERRASASGNRTM
jgi:hypothetical protein